MKMWKRIIEVIVVVPVKTPFPCTIMHNQLLTTIKPNGTIFLFQHSTGFSAAPLHLVHVKSSNTLTTATITWESVGNNVSYTVNSTSVGAPFSGITQTSYTLRDLEVGTDYVVSVTATNECGNIESPPSEEITVRIDRQGTMYMCMYMQ